VNTFIRPYRATISGLILVLGLVIAPPHSRGAGAGDDAAEGIPLPMKVRVFLANVEESGITLSTMGFPAVKAAIRAGDHARLAGYFSGDFNASIMSPDDGRFEIQGPVELKRITRSSPDFQPTKMNAAEFAAFLIQLKNRFTPESLALDWKLRDLLPVIPGDYSGAYNSTGQLRVAGITPEGRPTEIVFEFTSYLPSIPAPDEIADTRGWISAIGMTEITVTRAPHKLLADVTASSGIDQSDFWDNWTAPTDQRIVSSGGLNLADINNDGYTDVLVSDIKGPHLYIGTPEGGFKDVTRGFGLPTSKPVTIATFGDFDGDGLVDLVADNKIYKNLGENRFRDYSARSSLKNTDATSYSVVDYDRDGRVDLYVSRGFNTGKKESSWIDGPGGPGNQLWRNLGDWQFEDVTEKANAAAGPLACFTTVWLDVNNDNWPDAYSINEFGGGRLLVNQQDGTFESRLLLKDYNDFGSMGLAAADINNDGLVDIFTANMFSKAGRRVMENLPAYAYPSEVMNKIKRFVTGSELYLNEGDLKFKRAGRDMHVYQVGWSYGPSFVDLDNDGFQDLYATSGFMSADPNEPDG
jgi:hypothetical protein